MESKVKKTVCIFLAFAFVFFIGAVGSAPILFLAACLGCAVTEFHHMLRDLF